MKMSESRYGYMCKTDFDYELGEALGGNTVYASITDLCESRKCVTHCGIVKVKIELEQTLVDDDMRNTSDDQRTVEEVKKTAKNQELKNETKS